MYFACLGSKIQMNKGRIFSQGAIRSRGFAFSFCSHVVEHYVLRINTSVFSETAQLFLRFKIPLICEDCGRWKLGGCFYTLYCCLLVFVRSVSAPYKMEIKFKEAESKGVDKVTKKE